MKKKVVAILLCVLIVCSLSIALVACDNDKDNGSKYVGNYVGYIEGQAGVQLYMTIFELQESVIEDDYYPISIVAVHPNGSGFNIDSKLVFGEPIFINAVGNTTYLPLQNYSISEIVNDAFTLRAVSGQIVSRLQFKRTDMELNQWKGVAYKTVDGGVIPYFYVE